MNIAGIPIRVPDQWSPRWFIGWYRDVLLDLARRRVELKESGAMHLTPLAADPTAPANGDIWLNSTAGKLRARIGGVTVDLN